MRSRSILLLQFIKVLKKYNKEKLKHNRALERIRQSSIDKENQFEDDIEKIKLKQQIAKKKFEKVWKQNAPNIDVPKYLNKFEKSSGALVPELLDVVMRVLSASNAVSSVNDALESKFNAHQTKIAINEINNVTTKLSRIQIVKLLMDNSFAFDNETKQAILSLVIQKEFGKTIIPQDKKSDFNISDFMRMQMMGEPSPRLQNKKSVFTRKRNQK